MSLYDFMVSLQKKPLPNRRKILVSLLALSFLLLSLFWVFTFKRQTQQGNVFSKDAVKSKETNKLPLQLLSPLAALKDGFKSLSADISQQLKGVLESVSPSSPTGPDSRTRPIQKLP